MVKGLPVPVIDTHQHFWDPEVTEFPWMTQRLAALKRKFSPEDLAPLLASNHVEATVLVQTWHSVEETEQFLDLAARTNFVAGVVGWVDLTATDVAATLAQLRAPPSGRLLVGIRHLVHDEPDRDWLREEVRRGLAALQNAGLAFDLLLRPADITTALRTVSDFPGLNFVVDHIAKPDIANGAFSSWSSLMRGFGPHRSHVWCKLSGMAEEADWQTWTPGQLRPYIREVLDIFGPERCLYGSNWPVCQLAGDYERIKSALEENLDELSCEQRAAVMGGNAIAAYQLTDVPRKRSA
jgi:L-fuconolactonase